MSPQHLASERWSWQIAIDRPVLCDKRKNCHHFHPMTVMNFKATYLGLCLHFRLIPLFCPLPPGYNRPISGIGHQRLSAGVSWGRQGERQRRNDHLFPEWRPHTQLARPFATKGPMRLGSGSSTGLMGSFCVGSEFERHPRLLKGSPTTVSEMGSPVGWGSLDPIRDFSFLF